MKYASRSNTMCIQPNDFNKLVNQILCNSSIPFWRSARESVRSFEISESASRRTPLLESYGRVFKPNRNLYATSVSGSANNPRSYLYKFTLKQTAGLLLASTGRLGRERVSALEVHRVIYVFLAALIDFQIIRTRTRARRRKYLRPPIIQAYHVREITPLEPHISPSHL